MLCGLGEFLETFTERSIRVQPVSKSEPDGCLQLFATISFPNVASRLIGGSLMAIMYAIRNIDGESYSFCFLSSAVLLLCFEFPGRLG